MAKAWCLALALLACSVSASFYLEANSEEKREFLQNVKRQVKSELVEDCREAAIDLVFVVDSSNSICPRGVPHGGICDNWVLMRNFLKDIVSILPIGSGSTSVRVGLVLFGYDGEVRFELDAYSSKRALKNQLDNLPYLNGDTNIADGIRKMRTSVFGRRGDRQNAMNVGIIITDGNPNVEVDATFRQVELAIRNDITLFAVGITRDIHEPVLKKLSSPPRVKNQNYFMTPNFASLQATIYDLMKSTCKPAPFTPDPVPECENVKFDLTFVVDSSNSICDRETVVGGTCTNWNLIRGFLSKLVSKLPLDNGQARVGLVLFGQEGNVQWKLDEFRGSSASSAMRSRIAALPYLNQWTNIADGIRKARTQVFKKRGDRSDAANVIVLITDGQPNVEEDKTEIQANLAMQKEGIKMFSVGITSEVSATMLKSLSSSPKRKNVNFFMSPTFVNLDGIINGALQSICQS